MLSIDLSHDAAEASDLLAVEHEPLLEQYGFDSAFWACLDEESADRALVLVGHNRGEALDQGWTVHRLRGQVRGDEGKTQDSEALTRDEHGQVWLFGSQFGKKAGPLQPSRAFVARFSERETSDARDHKPNLELCRRPFALHRAINDALVQAGLRLLPLGPNVRERYIAKTMRRNYERNSAWANGVRVEDYPINIEGAQALGDDTFLLGLRFPTTLAGKPIIMRVHGLSSWFEGHGDLQVDVAAILQGVAARDRPLGVRALTLDGEELHAIIGPIGSQRKPTAIDIDYPESTGLPCFHVRFPQPAGDEVTRAEAGVVARFAHNPNIEGLARSPAGIWHYAIDDDHRFRLFIAT